jgi:HEAT repeat protein
VVGDESWAVHQSPINRQPLFIALVPAVPHAYTTAGSCDDSEGHVMALFSAKKVRTIGGLMAVILILGGGAAWLQRERLRIWYYLHQLARADEQGSAVWAERLASLGDVALPGLLDCLASDDELTCANARAALEQTCARLPQDDARWKALTDRILDAFPRWSAPGQRCVLALTAEWLRPAAQPSAVTLAYGVNVLNAAGQTSDSAARALALDIAAGLLASDTPTEAFGPCRALARICLQDSDGKIRERAVHLALYSQLELLAEVAPMLRDPVVEVRRAVVLAVGGSRAALADERLALALHDSDAEVRRLCEKALLGRGLTRQHVLLARMVTDARPATRLQILSYLREDCDLDTASWLRLLTYDPAEAVRFAAMRAIVERSVVELNDRLEQMGTNDPSPTVCRWARYYAGCLKQQQASSGQP